MILLVYSLTATTSVWIRLFYFAKNAGVNMINLSVPSVTGPELIGMKREILVRRELVKRHHEVKSRQKSCTGQNVRNGNVYNVLQ